MVSIEEYQKAKAIVEQYEQQEYQSKMADADESVNFFDEDESEHEYYCEYCEIDEYGEHEIWCRENETPYQRLLRVGYD